MRMSTDKTVYVLDSPYYEQINSAVLQLQEAGVLKHLKVKWWYGQPSGGACRHMVSLIKKILSTFLFFRTIWNQEDL